MGNATDTAKQQAVLAAIAKYPPELWAKKVMGGKHGPQSPRAQATLEIATSTGVSRPYVCRLLQILEAKRIGEEARARQAAMPVPREMSLSKDVNIDWFVGWPDAFYRVKILAERLMFLAQKRRDAYAESFLADICDVAHKAQSRAVKAEEYRREVKGGSTALGFCTSD